MEGGEEVASQLEGALLLGHHALAGDDGVQSLELLGHVGGSALGQHLLGGGQVLLAEDGVGALQLGDGGLQRRHQGLGDLVLGGGDDCGNEQARDKKVVRDTG